MNPHGRGITLGVRDLNRAKFNNVEGRQPWLCR
jgi:hypothetical protein